MGNKRIESLETKIARLRMDFKEHQKDYSQKMDDAIKAIRNLTTMVLGLSNKVGRLQPITKVSRYDAPRFVIHSYGAETKTTQEKKQDEEEVFQESSKEEETTKEPISLVSSKTYSQQNNLGLLINSDKLEASSIERMKKKVVATYAKIQGNSAKEQWTVTMLCKEEPILSRYRWNEEASKGTPYEQVRRDPIDVLAENYPYEWGIYTLRTRCVLGMG